MRVAITVLAVLTPLCAQQLQLPPGLAQLGAKAEESVEVTLDKSMLGFAGKFLSDREEEARAKMLLGGLESITVRSFEFRREGEYNMADVDALRGQFQPPAWSRVVGVRSRDGENVDVFFKNAAGGQLGGVVIVCAEPTELTIVHLVGTIEPEQLADLGGRFHIPKLYRVGRDSEWRRQR